MEGIEKFVATALSFLCTYYVECVKKSVINRTNELPYILLLVTNYQHILYILIDSEE